MAGSLLSYLVARAYKLQGATFWALPNLTVGFNGRLFVHIRRHAPIRRDWGFDEEPQRVASYRGFIGNGRFSLPKAVGLQSEYINKLQRW